VRSERLAVFEKRQLTNVGRRDLLRPQPDAAQGDTASTLTTEATRAIATRRCLYCEGPLTRLDHWQDDDLLLCEMCGYWVGRGARVGGPAGNRVVRGVIDLLDIDDATLDQLLLNISRLPGRLRTMSPFRAEKFMMELLAESLECEVRPMGGRRDGGVDGYILSGDGARTIVQVKWRETGPKGETVSVVRELAGTMLAQGVPSALLVTTRNWMSSDSQKEIERINGRKVDAIGTLEVSTMVYKDILDMLELAWTRRGGDFQSVLPWLRLPDDGGASFGINRDWVFDFHGAL
jgi:restriction system protein